MAVITKEENNGFRMLKALSECGRRVLHHTFCWGTPDKPATTTLDHYLSNLKQTSSANYLKLKSKDRRFDKTQKKLINRSANGREFDVPLLCRSIKLACENVAPLSDPVWITDSAQMESYITAINNMRNNAAHGPLAVTDEDYHENMRKFRELLTGCLKTSGERYGRDQTEVNKEIQQMNDDLDYIMNEILSEEDIMKYCSDDIKQIIIKDSCGKLKEILQQITCVNPVPCISDNFQLEVDKIFVDIEIKQVRRRGNNEHIDYRDLLSLVQTTSVASCVSSGTQQQGSSPRPQILLLEGVAGSGKTTLVKLITKQFIQGGQGNIKDLDNYDLLLWVQCRDPTINSYHHLLHRLLPDVSAKFRNIVPKIIKLCKVIIIVDGLDELNNNSRTLVKSLLLEFQNSINTTFICTSRPETVEIFSLTIPEDYDVTNANLRGIKQEHMAEFVRQTHQEIIKLTNSNRNTFKLVRKVMEVTGLHEHLRLPMNLTFLVYILDQEPDELNIRTITQTQLYHKIHHMCQSKLLERLTNCSKTKIMNESSVQNGVQEILKIIYATSLESLSRDQLSLEEETVDELISACNKHDIPYHEMLSAFLSLKPIWTWQGIKERYSAPHKGIQDYFSALHIVMTLKHQLECSPLPVLYTHHPAPPVSSQPPVITVPLSSTPLVSSQPTVITIPPSSTPPVSSQPSWITLSPLPTPPVSSRLPVTTLSPTQTPPVTIMQPSQTQPSPSPVTSSPTSPISTSPTPASPTPAPPTPASPTPAPPTPTSPTPALPTPASPTPASPTPAPPTPASPTPALRTPVSPTPAPPTPAPATSTLPTQTSPTSAPPTSAPSTPASPTQASPTPASPTPALRTPLLPTPAPATSTPPTPTSPTPTSPTSAPPTSAPSTPASPTPASSTPASLTHCTPVSISGMLEEIIRSATRATPICTREVLEESIRSATPSTPINFRTMHLEYFISSAIRSAPVNIMGVLKESIRSATTVSIREVLKESIRSGVVDINKYQNVLIHVAGLLHLVLDQVPEAPAREVVHLLHESGVRCNHQWLDLLDNTNMSPVIVKKIAHCFNTEATIDVIDEHVRSYAALLSHLSSCKVEITITRDPGDLPDLPDLLAALNHHHCTHLVLYHHYFYADTTTTSTNQLKRLQPRSHLEKFIGCLTGGGVRLLEECHQLRHLQLAVVSDHHAGHLLPQLHHTVTSTLHQLKWLIVKVSAAAVSAAAMTSLPSTEMVMLHLTDVSDDIASHACDLAQKLQPPGGYCCITCPSSTITAVGIQDMI
ncbi:hypothetical protein OTU49_003332, partial [Cherax quadricarinatus]